MLQFLVEKDEVNVDFVLSDMQIRKRSEKYFLCESMQRFKKTLYIKTAKYCLHLAVQAVFEET